MSFREKTAWLMAAALAVTGLWYAQNVAALSGDMGQIAPPSMVMAIEYLVLLIGLVIAGNLVLMAIGPREEDEAMDERDQIIAARAGNASGYILAAGVLSALGHFLFLGDGNALFHGVFLSLVVSNVADYSLQIYFYRRSI